MSLHSYHVSTNLLRKDPPFYALVMAAMKKADTGNLMKLQSAFPEVWLELQARYDAPLEVIPADGPVNMEDLARRVDELRRQK